MRKEERIILLKREVKEISDLLTGIQGFEDVPEVLIDLLYQKSLHLAEGVEMLKGDKEQYPDLEENPTDSVTLMFPEVMEQVMEEESKAKLAKEIITEEIISESADEVDYDNIEGFKDVTSEEECCGSLDIVEEDNKEATSDSDIAEVEEVKESVETADETNEEEEDKPVIKKVFEQVFRTHSADSNITAKKEDFRRLMTLNDRFLFQRELFHGDVGMLNHTIDVINDQDNSEVAKAYIREEFKWDEENLTVHLFMDMIDRHFTE